MRGILPSRDENKAYYPCKVVLHNGTVHERVYLIDAVDYARSWGHNPGRSTLTASEIAAVEESPERLPPVFADQLYAAGESGMGFCMFTVRFRDGTQQAYVTGNAIDFLQLPNGRTAGDVVAVLAHTGRESQSALAELPYEWCPVNGLSSRTDRPDDLRWVYAVQPALFVGSVASLSAFLLSRLLITSLAPNGAFLVLIATFLAVTTTVVAWRIWRRSLDVALYRSQRPRGYSLEDDWRYCVRFLFIGLGTGALVLLLLVALRFVVQQ